MEFRVEREALGEAVAWVARELPARPVIPVLSGLLVEAAGAGLTLSCFDYEVSARVVLPAEVSEPGTVLVPGRLLAEITRSLPQQLVTVSSDADMVRLTCGSAEFELVSLPVAEYPGLPEPPEACGTVDGGVLAAAAAQVVPSASRDDTLPMLTGVCLDVSGSQMTLAATDRYRLAVRTVNWTPASPGLRAAALVPARTLADVARAMGPGVRVTIAFSVPEAGGAGDPRPAEGMISFEGGGRRLTARLIGGDFIRYQSRFPGEFGCRALLPSEQFTAAVRRVSLVADRASSVRLTFSEDQVVVEAQTAGRARAAETVRATFTGTEPAIAFNPAYLLDGLTAAAVSGGAGSGGAGSGSAGSGATGSGGGAGEQGGAAPEPGRIQLQFTSPAKPALITWVGYDIAETSEDDAAAGDGSADAAESSDGAGRGSRTAGEDIAEVGEGGGRAGQNSGEDPDGGPADSGDLPGDTGPRSAAGAAGAAALVREVTPAFRYLVVPLRSPAGPGRG